MTFHVGQKVVCVDDTNWLVDPSEYAMQPPLKGEVYEVSFVDSGDLPRGDQTGLLPPGVYLGLVELDALNGFAADDGLPHVFAARRFRPAVSPKTDISIFEEIRDRAVKGEPVDA